MSSRRKALAILGVTGRLGPAVARAFGDWNVRGLSRRAPAEGESLQPGVFLVVGSRQDQAALRLVCDGADLVVDLLGGNAGDADLLLEALRAMTAPPQHLIFASSIAELPVRGKPPEGDGLGKRAARVRYQLGFAGRVHTVVLPRLVAEVDIARREQPYLDAALAGGRAIHTGDGTQRQTIAPVEGVAAVVRALADAPDRVPAGPLLVGPPTAVSVSEAIAALLEGAGVTPRLAPHPDRGWRGPHGGGNEVVDTRTLQRAFPSLRWPDVLGVHRRLGAWLAANPPEPERPGPLVSLRKRAFRGRTLVDVHGRRAQAPFECEAPALTQLASWLSPAFYIDFGRPCNAACLYCAVPPHADTEGFTPIERVREQIEAGRGARCDRAIFIGGEPTIYPQLREALALLDSAGFPRKHVLMSNGLRLADASVLGALVDGGVRTLHISIDTASEEIYTKISRSSGSLARQHAALRNALRLHRTLNVYVYAAMTQLNAHGAPALIESVARLADEVGTRPPPVVLAFVKPIGDALVHAALLSMSPEERARTARSAVTRAHALGVDVAIRNLQACLAPELAPLLIDYYVEDYAVDASSGERAENPHVATHESSVAACTHCAHRELCPGVYIVDRDRFGEAAYRALPADGLRASAT